MPDDLAPRPLARPPPDFDDGAFLDGFPTPDGKFHFKPDWAALGQYHAKMPALPDYMRAATSAPTSTPFRLVTAPARRFLNSTFTETPTRANARGGRPC